MRTTEKQKFALSQSVILAMNMAREALQNAFGKDVSWHHANIIADAGYDGGYDEPRYSEHRNITIHVQCDHPTEKGFTEVFLKCRLSKSLLFWEPRSVEFNFPKFPFKFHYENAEHDGRLMSALNKVAT